MKKKKRERLNLFFKSQNQPGSSIKTEEKNHQRRNPIMKLCTFVNFLDLCFKMYSQNSLIKKIILIKSYIWILVVISVFTGIHHCMDRYQIQDIELRFLILNRTEMGNRICNFCNSKNECIWYFPGGLEGKASACDVGDPGSIPSLGRSPGEGSGNPLQYSCLENPKDGGAPWATVHRATKNRTWLSNYTHLRFKKFKTLKKLRSWHLVPSLHGKGKGKMWKQWQILFSWAPQITADSDCSHETKRRLLLGRKAKTNLVVV